MKRIILAVLAVLALTGIASASILDVAEQVKDFDDERDAIIGRSYDGYWRPRPRPHHYREHWRDRYHRRWRDRDWRRHEPPPPPPPHRRRHRRH